jgi:N-acetylmuramoyl-L-alanine amidase-like
MPVPAERNVMMNRRRLLRMVGGAALLGPVPVREVLAMLQEKTPPGDEEVFLRVIKFAAAGRLAEQPIGVVVEAVGRYFLGAPYTAHTLESPGDECLVVNLREFDCTTFMENALVLARCVKKRKETFEEYRGELTFVRYRHGVLKGYPSRLHYLTDWVWDNAVKKVLLDMGKMLGGERSRKTIDFMTTHTASYRQLSDSAFVKSIAAVEREMTRRGFYAVPANRIRRILHRLQSGDIIGTVTTMEGMDVSHTGVVAVDGGVPRFLHAPLSGGKVVLAEGSVADYVEGRAGVTGIVVARPLEP